MITFIISAVIVGILSMIVKFFKMIYDKGNQIAKEDKIRKKAQKEMLPVMLEMEEMGFTVRALDKQTAAALSNGRANKARLLSPDTESCTLNEVIAACYLYPEYLDKLEAIFNSITSQCNVRISPDAREEIARFSRNLTHDQAVKKAMKILNAEVKVSVSFDSEDDEDEEADGPAFHVEMTADEMDDLIEGIYARVALLEKERETVTDEVRRLELDEKIAHLKLEAAIRRKLVDELRSMEE